MKFFIRTFFVILAICIITENIFSSVTPFLIQTIGHYYILIYPVGFIVILAILHFLNILFKDKLDFLIRLYCIYFFMILLYNIFNDFFPFRFEGYKYMVGLSVEQYYKSLVILYVCGAISSGYFFAHYQFARRDFIFILMFFISIVFMKLFQLQNIVNLF